MDATALVTPRVRLRRFTGGNVDDPLRSDGDDVVAESGR
jgi:hypothetical protein